MNKQLQRDLERDIASSIPYKENRTFDEYSVEFKKQLLAGGYIATNAQYDEAGNCLLCGESGRCFGWHIADEDY